MNIEANIQTYLGERNPTARYASFDYCFNYFQEHREKESLPDLVREESLQLSCLHLGFYLASWGMLRGSTDLLKRSVKVLAPVVAAIAGLPRQAWEIDVDGYGDGRCEVVFDTARRLDSALPTSASDTLITKIMLGTVGCVPAFDTNFKKGFRVSTFGPKALNKIAAFYAANRDVIERHRVQTLDFGSGECTDRPYSRAKVIDMIFFVAGSATISQPDKGVVR